MALAPFQNADLEFYPLTNTGAASVYHRKFVALDKSAAGGMCALDDSNAGEIAGVLEDMGAPADGNSFVATETLPTGQRGRVRRRGMNLCRAVAVACVPGTKAYLILSGAQMGRVTNTSNSAANPQIGRFMTGTGGVVDELVTVDIAFV